LLRLVIDDIGLVKACCYWWTSGLWKLVVIDELRVCKSSLFWTSGLWKLVVIFDCWFV